MPKSAHSQTELRVSDLDQNAKTAFDFTPDKADLSTMAKDLGVLELRKVRFSGEISAEGKRDWRLDGRLGATVRQTCVVTLEPVTTRIETVVARRFLVELAYGDDDDEEIEMPEDETIEQLGTTIDLGVVLQESLALNLPLYPRKEGAEISQSAFTEPGKKAMTDEDARPFAALGQLRDQLAANDEDEGQK